MVWGWILPSSNFAAAKVIKCGICQDHVGCIDKKVICYARPALGFSQCVIYLLQVFW